MTGHRVAVYYAWDRLREIEAPLGIIENRFPALFESRRILYPHYEELSDPERFDQGIAGFLDEILRRNFEAFVEQAEAETGHAVLEMQRGGEEGVTVRLDARILESADTVIVISFDSQRTGQRADSSEIEAVATFLSKPGNMLFICPHHDIGNVEDAAAADRTEIQTEHFLHHGDRTIPPQQRFGGFARSLLSGLGLPVENRFGLHPASEPDGSPSPIAVEHDLDRHGLLAGVTSFNLHPHLPHFERLREAVDKLDVIACQKIDPDAPSHRFTRDGRSTFDAMLQSRSGLFGGDLLIADATLWSSTAGGLDNLRRFWRNVVTRGT